MKIPFYAVALLPYILTVGLDATKVADDVLSVAKIYPSISIISTMKLNGVPDDIFGKFKGV